MTDQDSQTGQTRLPRRQFDPILLILGVVTLAIAGYIIGRGYLPFPHLDARWVLAGGGLLVGLLMLTASLRPKRRRDR
ncbi:MAG TPA: hypothetical protein VG247_36765 [Pseudonocardiaceae bacterium]|jgi:hypothetical protein|nr:hypothetical protein [Pseudonocardiaceae bacterium]